MRQCAELPRRETLPPIIGGRHGDKIHMTPAVLGVESLSRQSIREVDGNRVRAVRRRSHHRPVLAPWQVKLAKTFMLGRITEPLHLPDVANMCRLSAPYFVRAFTNTVGVAPYTWFMGNRVSKAQSMLANSALPLAQIAVECGFSDQAHFTKAFSKVTGVTPARWRRGNPNTLKAG